WRLPKPPTDQPAGKPDATALLAEIMENLKAATANAVSLMRRAVTAMATRNDELAQCPALESLRLAIWSQKAAIDPQEVQRLAPLWMRYFEDAASKDEGDTAGGDGSA